MELRRILLRIMLAALAIAALAGVLAVVVAAGDTLWRIVGTAITTAGAVGLLLPFSLLVDKAKWRRAGLFAMAWTIGDFLLILALIWGESLYHYSSPWEHIAMTLGWWLLCGAAAIVFLLSAGVPWLRVTAWTGTALAGVVFVLLEIGTWIEWPREDCWFGMAGALAGIGTAAVACLGNVGQRDRRWWRWVGVAVAAVGWVLAVVGIWRGTNSEVGQQMLAGFIGLAAWVGLANMVLLAPLQGMQHVVRWGTMAAGLACAGAINLMAYCGSNPIMEFVERAAAGSAIVTGCGVLALLVLGRMNRRVEFRPEEGSKVMTDITVFCPRCHHKQHIMLGGGQCGACGLRIAVRVEEPRCPTCGYLLYMLTTPRCPECGTTI